MRSTRHSRVKVSNISMVPILILNAFNGFRYHGSENVLSMLAFEKC